MSASAARAGNLIHDPAYAELKRHVIQSTGLAYYNDKDDDLAFRLSGRITELGLHNCADYLLLLTTHDPAESEHHRLVAQLTIGETYFFRHTEQFDALRETVIPSLIRQNADSRRLRIWSAGCATGAEPYSIAILLKQSFATQLAGWDVQVIGTDINQAFLAHARRGIYADWAMRATSEAMKMRWFTREEKHWVLAPEGREWVSFQYHNLVEHPFPSLVHNLVALDLILCRNVMIYFDRARIRTMVDRFHECLAERGWLIVGHAETSPEIAPGYVVVNAPGTTLFRKDSGAAQRIETLPSPAREPVMPAAADMLLTWTPPELPAVPAESRAPHTVSRSGDDGMARIKRLADEGKWTDAIRCCEDLLRVQNLNPSLHFYKGLVLGQAGRTTESEQSLRRAIYLDRQFALAHYHLGLLLQKNDDDAGGLQSLRNAARILSRLAPSMVFPEADGMTVAEFQELVAMQMEASGE